MAVVDEYQADVFFILVFASNFGCEGLPHALDLNVRFFQTRKFPAEVYAATDRIDAFYFINVTLSISKLGKDLLFDNVLEHYECYHN